MKQFLHVLVLSLFFASYAKEVSAQLLMFQKKVGGGNWEYAYAIQKTLDSGYILGGVTSSFGAGPAGNFDMYVVKMNKKGDTVWTRTYGGSCTKPEVINDIFPTSDSGFVITGYTGCWGTNTDCYIIRIKSNGDTVWTRHWGGTGGDDGYGIIQDKKGNILITGNENTYGSGNLDAMFIKLNGNGDTLWSKVIGGTQVDWGYCIQQCRDGNYVIGGYTSSFGTGGKDMMLVKADTNGNLMWSKTYGGTNDDIAYGHCVQQTRDGGFILTGYTSSFGAGLEDVYLVKTDSLGNVQWSKAYGGAKDDFGHCVKQTKDGGYVVAGFTKSFGNGGGTCNNAFLLKTDSVGNLSWARTYGGDGKASTGTSSADGAYGMVIANDGGYVITGLTNSWGVNANDEDMYIIKTDTLGNSNCANQTSPVFTVTSPSTVQVSISPVVMSGSATMGTGTIVSSGGFMDTICYTAAAIDTTHTGITTYTKGYEVKVYPNPANGNFNICFVSDQPTQIGISIIDQLGKQVYANDLISKMGLNIQNIETRGWVAGIYFIKLMAGNESIVLKIIVQ